MTVQYVSGNLLNDSSEALTNAVNCIGVMGIGIALAFKKKFPEMFKQYAEDCANKVYEVSEVRPWRFVDETEQKERFVLNFPTMYYPGSWASLDEITAGLKDMKWLAGHLGIKSIAVPALGCGVGGLSWNSVKEQIEKVFIHSDVAIKAYSPLG